LSISERRHGERLDFDLPLIVRCTEGSERREAQTVTQDMRSGGMYSFLRVGMPEGTAVEVEMTLPTQITLGASTRVRCQGCIRRCELKAGKTAGMVAAIEK
jgi:hypothetical protein